MANLHRDALNLYFDFRYVKNIQLLSEQELNDHGYYKGFVCPHGHTIRDKEKHWCYACVRKIKDNICGLDVNYLHPTYKHRYLDLWSRIPVGDITECWEAPALTTSRVCMPSYRSQYTTQQAANVSTHKAIYQSVWGDVGSMFVTRTCKNKYCLNPLHLVSTWNRSMPPSEIHPFEYAFDPEKLMAYNQKKIQNQEVHLIEREYRQTIQHPLFNKNTPDYDT